MPDYFPCELCGADALALPRNGRDILRARCSGCSEYSLSGTAGAMLRGLSVVDRRRLGYWVVEQHRNDVIPDISSDDIPRILARPLPRFSDRADRLLLAAIASSLEPGVVIDTENVALQMASYSQNAADVRFLCELLAEKDLAVKGDIANRYQWKIKPTGYVYADELRSKPAETRQAFVAMRFSAELRPIFDGGFGPGIIDAGYEPLRIDNVEHVDKIDDRLMAEIRRSRFIVADLTDQNRGVYLEAGFALGLGLPVIWTCRHDDVENLHFDIRQYNHLLWIEADDLREKLRRRIEFVIGRGLR